MPCQRCRRPPEASNNANTRMVEDDPTWTQGNAEIISSDGVRFRVHEHHLISAR